MATAELRMKWLPMIALFCRNAQLVKLTRGHSEMLRIASGSDESPGKHWFWKNPHWRSDPLHFSMTAALAMFSRKITELNSKKDCFTKTSELVSGLHVMRVRLHLWMVNVPRLWPSTASPPCELSSLMKHDFIVMLTRTASKSGLSVFNSRKLQFVISNSPTWIVIRRFIVELVTEQSFTESDDSANPNRNPKLHERVM
jgi:hypothetical protein